MIRALLIVFVCGSVLTLSACSSPEEADFHRAQKETSEGHFKVALDFFDRVVKRNAPTKYPVEAAREAARISFYELKDFNKAIDYQHFLVLHSTDEKERVESQKQIAAIYFNNLQNYPRAIIEYSKLQQMPHTDQEAAQYKMNVARAQYYLNNFFQSESEIDSLLKLRSDDNIHFQALMLKGNILVGKKNFAKAAEIFRGLMVSYPEKAIQDNVPLTLAVCYEESSDYKAAIKVLEDYRSHYNPGDYIELRIKRLQERQKNAPGARGLRK